MQPILEESWCGYKDICLTLFGSQLVWMTALSVGTAAPFQRCQRRPGPGPEIKISSRTETLSRQAKEDAVKVLDRYALVTRRPAKSAFNVHQLVHQALHQQLQAQGEF
jgi:hypothetical protein